MGFAYLLVNDYDSARDSYLEAQSIFEELGLTEDALKQNEYLEFVENYDPDSEWVWEIQ